MRLLLVLFLVVLVLNHGQRPSVVEQVVFDWRVLDALALDHARHEVVRVLVSALFQQLTERVLVRLGQNANVVKGAAIAFECLLQQQLGIFKRRQQAAFDGRGGQFRSGDEITGVEGRGVLICREVVTLLHLLHVCFVPVIHLMIVVLPNLVEAVLVFVNLALLKADAVEFANSVLGGRDLVHVLLVGDSVAREQLMGLERHHFVF